jgi:hypothetical protein
MNIEEKLKSLKFRKRWLSDKSGYWYESKSITIGDAKFYIYCDPDFGHLNIEVKSGNQLPLSIKKYKCNSANLSRAIKTLQRFLSISVE